MSLNRDEDQKRWSCLSVSLLFHGAIGATVALAPMANAKKEQPSAVYLQESKEIPKGEQLETLPPAPAAEPVAQVVKAKEVVAAKPSEKIATTLPQKKTTTQAKADEPDISVKSALAAARAEETEAEAFEKGEPLLSPAAIAQQQEDEGLKAEPVEEATASAATAPVAEEAQTPEPIQKETPSAATVAAVETETAKTEASAPASQPAKEAVAPATTTGTGNGAKAAPATAYGVRDADSLKQAAGNKNPMYPERDRLARNQGTAVFLARVLPNGSVTDIQLQQSTNSKTLDNEAVEAMKNWRFLPGQEGMIRKAFQFSLNGNAQEIPARLRR